MIAKAEWLRHGLILIACLAALYATWAGRPAVAEVTIWPENAPENAIVRVNLETGGHCTGFAIDRRTVATAAHCLWLARPRHWIQPTSLHVLVGYDRGEFRQHARVRAYRIAADFRPNAVAAKRGEGGDWALLELSAPIEGPVLPLVEAPPAPLATLALAGYPAARGHRMTARVACRVVKLGRGYFRHDCPAGPGQSGAPLFALQAGAWRAFGLHVASGGGQGLAVTGAAILAGRTRRPY